MVTYYPESMFMRDSRIQKCMNDEHRTCNVQCPMFVFDEKEQVIKLSCVASRVVKFNVDEVVESRVQLKEVV